MIKACELKSIYLQRKLLIYITQQQHYTCATTGVPLRLLTKTLKTLHRVLPSKNN